MKKKEEVMIRVFEHPVVEYDDRTVDTLLRVIAGVGLSEFVDNVYANKDGLYDKLFGDDETKQTENK